MFIRILVGLLALTTSPAFAIELDGFVMSKCRDNTCLIQCRFAGDVMGFYLVDFDESGQVVWETYTDKGPDGLPVMELAQGADVGSTFVALSQGFAETNPLGLPVITGGKAALVYSIKQSSAHTCYYSYGPVTSLGWGATAVNLLYPVLGVGAAIPAITTAIVGAPSHNTKFWACAPKL